MIFDTRPPLLPRIVSWIPLLLLLGLGFWGCGMKSMPVALETLEPAPVTDLRAWPKEKGIYLTWSLPAKNTDGSRLEDLLGFRVFRLDQPFMLGSCETCPLRVKPVAEIDIEYPQGARVEGDKVLWLDENLQPLTEYTYFTVAYNAYKSPGPDSNRVNVSWDTPPAAPTDVSVKSGDKALEIHWEPVRRLLDGRTLIEAPLFLKASDLKDPVGLAIKLRDAEGPFPRHLQEELSPGMRLRLDEYHRTPLFSFLLTEELVAELNRILRGESLYEAARQASVPLPERVSKLAQKNPRGEELLRLNRWILDEAFPQEIAAHLPGLAGFNIYRRGEGESFGFRPLNVGPLSEKIYWDAVLQNGKRYYYEVRAVRNFQGTLIEGPASAPAMGIPEKTIPPSAPSGLSAVFTENGVELRWDKSPEPDVAGYDLYRREGGSGEYTKINGPPILENYFFDPTADPRKTYLYRLKAVEAPPAGKESEFSQEVEVAREKAIGQP
jgi:hypothetical protein